MTQKTPMQNCLDCQRKLSDVQILRKVKLCSNCRSRNHWKEEFSKLRKDTDRRFTLYDIYINQLVKKIREYEPNYERSDDER